MITAHFYHIQQLQAQKKNSSKNGCYHGKTMLVGENPQKQTHVAETGWTVSWRCLLDLVRTNNETENKQKHKGRMVVGQQYQSLWPKLQKLKNVQQGKHST